MRRFLLLVVSIASLALPAGAFARGGDYAFQGGTTAQHSQVRAALAASTFNWSAVPTRVTIHIKQGHSHRRRRRATSGSTLGSSAPAALPGPRSRTNTHTRSTSPASTLRRAIASPASSARATGATASPASHHAEYGCERFASTLVWAFWPSKDNAYRPTSSRDESAAMPPQQFRTLVTGLLGIDNVFAATR